MQKTIENWSLRHIDYLAGDNHQGYIGEELLVIMSTQQLGKILVREHQPYQLEDGRVMRILSGEAESIINMEPFLLSTGMLLVVPKHSVFEIERMSNNLNIQMFSFRDLPAESLFKSCTVFRLNDDDWHLTGEYIHLLWHTVNRQPLSITVVKALQTAMLNELHIIYNKEYSKKDHNPINRKDEIMHQFYVLLNKHGSKEHSVAFYADKICITPNHLGATVKEVSGATVQEWIHRYIIQQAKLMLKYSSTPVNNISEKLNFPNPSFFSKFFKRETGVTPLQYRED